VVNISSSKKLNIYAGIDIEPMNSPLSKSPPTYSLAIFQEDLSIFEKKNVRKKKLFEYLNKYNVNYLAIDNIFELVKNNSELYHIIKDLPIGIKIVQVTGNPAIPNTLKPLKIIAQQNNIKTDYTNPLESAKVCIELVRKKIGYLINLYKDETKITVSTAKIPGRGGQSANRYKRDLTGRILNISREIQSLLEKNKIDYDLSFRKNEYGLDYSHFLVYSDYQSIYTLIRPVFTPKIKIKISPIKKNQVEFIPLSGASAPLTKSKSLIIGLDPGITIGVAILDLKGNILDIFSKKQMSRNDLRKLIFNNYGIPSVVGTDIIKIPRFVEKFANLSQALIYHPKKVLKIPEKHELVNTFLKSHNSNIKIENAHERDALVSAIKAYQFFEKRFKKVDLRIHEMNLQNKVNADEVKKYIIKGYSIFDAISLASPSLNNESSKQNDSSESVITKIEKYNKQYYVLENRIKRLYNQNTILLNKIHRYKSEIKSLKEKNVEIDQLKHTIDILKSEQYKEFRKERYINSLLNEISSLKKQIHKQEYKIKELQNEITYRDKHSTFLEELNLMDKFYNIQIIPNFSTDTILNTKIINEIIYIDNISGGGSNTALTLIERGVKCIIYNSKISNMTHGAEQAFIKHNVIAIPSSEFDIYRINDYILINRKKFDLVYKKWIKKRENLLLQEKEKELSNILDDYRKKRIKEIQ